jgi:hypothetical protein
LKEKEADLDIPRYTHVIHISVSPITPDLLLFVKEVRFNYNPQYLKSAGFLIALREDFKGHLVTLPSKVASCNS